MLYNYFEIGFDESDLNKADIKCKCNTSKIYELSLKHKEDMLELLKIHVSFFENELKKYKK